MTRRGLSHGRKAMRKRRGLSVVITSLMLIVAASLMGTFLISWGNSTFASQRAIVANASSSRINQANEGMVVEDVWFFKNATGNYANVTIRNSGSVGLQVSTIAVNSSIIWNKGTSVVSSAASTITAPLSWKSGDVQSFWVTTKRGTQVQQAFRP